MHQAVINKQTLQFCDFMSWSIVVIQTLKMARVIQDFLLGTYLMGRLLPPLENGSLALLPITSRQAFRSHSCAAEKHVHMLLAVFSSIAWLIFLVKHLRRQQFIKKSCLIGILNTRYDIIYYFWHSSRCPSRCSVSVWKMPTYCAAL